MTTMAMTTLVLLSLTFLPFSTPTSTITLPLTKLIIKNTQPLDIYHHLTYLATSSLVRVHHLKNPKSNSTTTTTTTTTSTTPLSPHTYGGYSISLKFGTPPQTMPFIMDTGSNFVWFPCTRRYICNNCSYVPRRDQKNPIFIPKLSSTAKIVGCLNKKCGWLQNPNVQTRCPNCPSQSSNCTSICPPYLILYGSGSTGGISLLDTLRLDNDHNVPDFLVGCSLFSSRQPAGIAGFGRGVTSLPSQLGLEKFSYCLLSHRFDDSPVNSSLTLTGKPAGGEKLAGVQYTPFLKNPKIKTKKQFSVYYYLGLNEVFVGRKKLKIPRQFLSPPDPVTGDGGTIVDSGTTFTYMGRAIFERLAGEMERQVKGYKRAKGIELMTGLRPCFNVSDLETLSLPSLRFHFKGGAKMVLPLENYFSVAGYDEAVCLTIVSDPPGRPALGGPKVILGNFQQQNFYVEYDLRNNRFGFRHKKCG